MNVEKEGKKKMSSKKTTKKLKKKKFYGERIQGIWHAGSDDFWIRRLHTTLLAGNGAGLVLFLNFLKGVNWEETSQNLSDQLYPLGLFLLGVIACGLATVFGAFESSYKNRYTQDYKNWCENEFHENDYPDAQSLFNLTYSAYQIQISRFWSALIIALVISLTTFCAGIGMIVTQLIYAH